MGCPTIVAVKRLLNIDLSSCGIGSGRDYLSGIQRFIIVIDMPILNCASDSCLYQLPYDMIRKCNAQEPSSWLTERVSLATARHAVSSCPSLHEGLSVDARLRASCRLGSTQERRAAPGTKSRPEAERGTVRRVADTQGFAR
jgi:hypothetical protein